MKIIILTEGGKNIGFGHIARCHSLYQAFRENGYSPELIIFSDNSIEGLLDHAQYQIVNWLKKPHIVFQLLKSATMAIIDSYLAKKSLYYKISEIMNGRVVAIDDYNRVEYPAGIVLNPSLYGNRLHYSKREGVTYLLGKDYILLRRAFWNIPKKHINRKIRNILITFGGTNRHRLINTVTHFLKEEFNCNFYTIGPQKNIHDAHGTLNLMLKADICISGGGQTIHELARVGVPTIGICFAENQRYSLQEWRDRGFIEYIGWHKNKKLLSDLSKGIKKLKSHKKRCQQHKIGKALVDGKGAMRLLKVLANKRWIGNIG